MALKLLYSGAVTFQAEQKLGLKSLGGFASTSDVYDIINALFGDISVYTVNENKAEYRAIFLLNDGSTDLTGLTAYIKYPDESDDDTDSVLSIGSEAAVTDDCGHIKLQKIPSINGVPRGVTFTKPDVDNKLSLGTLSAGTYIGLWIKRELEPSLQTPKTDEQLEAIREAVEAGSISTEQDSIEIVFEWS